MARRTQRFATIAIAVLTLGAATTTGAGADDIDPVRQVEAVANAAVGGVDVPVIDRVGGVGDIAQPPTGFPPAGFAVTAVTWSKGPGATTPTFTPPNPAISHPASWSCTTSMTATTAHASCMPTSPYDPGTSGWACYDPYVVVDVSSAGSSVGDSITGSSHCGTSIATCTAATGLVASSGGLSTSTVTTGPIDVVVPTPAAHCQNWAFPQQPVPLECSVDFGAALPTSTWNVRCAPIDP